MTLRLPKSLLQKLNIFCDQKDFTKSQLIRHLLTDHIKSVELEQPPHQEVQVGIQTVPQQPPVQQAPVEPPRRWGQEFFDQLTKRATYDPRRGR
jgi:hypothetical protein